MALQTSGAISLNQIHVEAGGSSGTQASINDSDIRGLISKASGATMSFSEWYGASAYTAPSLETSFLATPSGNGRVVWRVNDGVSISNGSTSGGGVATTTFDTAAGRTIVITIHIIDDDSSDNNDEVYISNFGSFPHFSFTAHTLAVGLTPSSLLTSTTNASNTKIYNVTGQPDRGDRMQISIRFAVTSSMIGNSVRLWYRDDPDDDDNLIGLTVAFT